MPSGLLGYMHVHDEHTYIQAYTHTHKKYIFKRNQINQPIKQENYSKDRYEHHDSLFSHRLWVERIIVYINKE